jgi:hypothetical protein
VPSRLLEPKEDDPMNRRAVSRVAGGLAVTWLFLASLPVCLRASPRERLRATIAREVEGVFHEVARVVEALETSRPWSERAPALLRRSVARLVPGIVARIPRDLEVASARDFFEGFLMDGDDEPADLSRAQALLSRLAAVEPVLCLHAEVHVMGGGGLMAFGKGGDAVVLTDELVALPEDEAIAVLAHELAHREARDYVHQAVCRELLRALAKALPEEARPALTRLAQQVEAEVSQEAEFAADARATQALERAGLGRKALVTLLGRLLGAGEAGPHGTHPATEERLRRLTVNLD